jgi:hypothetical protein
VRLGVWKRPHLVALVTATRDGKSALITILIFEMIHAVALNSPVKQTPYYTVTRSPQFKLQVNPHQAFAL